MAQERSGIVGHIASAFCQGHAGRVGQNYAIFMAEKDKERITDIALKYYSDDSLHGYGDAEFSRADGQPLVEQQRGLIIPLVDKAIAADGPNVILEIGTGNGDVLAYLAERHPTVQFIGTDLSIVNAQLRHRLSNIRFVKGYALDLLRNGLAADMVFASSTFCVFAPKELQAYLRSIRTVKRLIISDPVTFGNKHARGPKPKSLHMDLYMWWHNYYGYLKSLGYTVEYAETVNFRYTYNPNAQVFLISAKR
jgi:SAM-dependent methyltransferase